MTDGEYFSALKNEAAKGGVLAAWTLAFAYAEGFVQREDGAWFSVRKNRPLAERLYRFVAKTKERDVILGLAAVLKDKGEALRLERKAWRMGVKEAANNIAMTYSAMGRADLCFKWLKRAYVADPSGSANYLALCHLIGYGTIKNSKEARRLFGLVIRRNRGTPDDQECAAQFIKMIDRGETPRPPRRGKTIGSIRPTLTDIG